MRVLSWVRKSPWSRKWQPTLVFLPGKLHGERSLAGYSSWGGKESDTTEYAPTTQKAPRKTCQRIFSRSQDTKRFLGQNTQSPNPLINCISKC